MVGPKAFIHLENLFHNYNLIKQQLNGIPIMAVVKANAMVMVQYLLPKPCDPKASINLLFLLLKKH